MDNTSFEPMDIDSSANSITYMDVSFSEPLEFVPIPIKQEIDPPSDNNSIVKSQPVLSHATTGVKIYHIVKKNDKKSAFNSTHIAVSIIIVTLLSILVYQILNVQCGGEFDPYYLSEKLHRRLYGQYMAVTDIVNAIKNESRTKILFFYGSTGVGKTYTVSLMLENRWNDTNVYHYTMPSFLTTFSTELMLGLTMCNTALFVVDDLTPADIMRIRNHINDVFQKTKEMNKNIVIILIINCNSSDSGFMTKCHEHFYKDIKNSFNNFNALKQIVKFEELSEQHLKKCIEDELGEDEVDEVKFRNILKNFNVSQDGCKGVHKKIKFLNSL